MSVIQTAKRVWKFSRSHDESYLDCPRKAYLNYYWGGTGIVRKALDLYQQTGQLTHEILRGVMRVAKEGRPPTTEEMRGICETAVVAYRAAVTAQGFSEFAGEVELEMQRQAALAEGLARAWTLIRLPLILESYKVLAVEEEHDVEFGPGQVLMSRLDGVLERKEDQELFAGPEFKTTGWVSEDYFESWRYSTQTLSHCLDIKAHYGRLPAGVMMEFLYKGVKKKAEDGSYNYYSPLVRAYRSVDAVSGVEIYGFDSALARKKDWVPFDAYAMGMEKWMEQLPLEVLEGMLYHQTIYRSQRELVEWELQVRLRQSRIQAGLLMMEDYPTEEAATEVMASVFPARLDQFCYSNQYRKRCPYLDICYHAIDDPIASGVYVAREPHHPGEVDSD